MSKADTVFGDKKEGVFELPFEMAVYVPSTQDVDQVISVDKMDRRVDGVRKYLAKLFGGYTSEQTLGGFIASDGELVNEDVVKVTSFSTVEDFENNKEALLKQIGKWGDQWGQEAIGFEYEGDLFYIPKKYGLGGFILGTAVGGYVGYKTGRARPQNLDFETEKKVGRAIGKGAKALGRGAKSAVKKVQTKKDGGAIRVAHNKLIHRSESNATHTIGFINPKTKNLHISPFASSNLKKEGEKWAKENGYTTRKTYKEGGKIPSDVDLFEHYQYIPKNIQAIIDKYELEEMDYPDLKKLNEELEAKGFTFEYGLDAEPYNLRKIGTTGNKELMKNGGRLKKIEGRERLYEDDNVALDHNIVSDKYSVVDPDTGRFMQDGGSVGQTILNQLGGNRFIAMTGANKFVQSAKDNWLAFRIGRNTSKANYVKIQLMPNDTYTVTFIRIHGMKYTELKVYDTIYFDQLETIFTEYTGLYTRLEGGGGIKGNYFEGGLSFLNW